MKCGKVASSHESEEPEFQPAAAGAQFSGKSFDRLLKGCPVDLEEAGLDADLRAADRMVRSIQGRAMRIDLPELPTPMATTAPRTEWEEPAPLPPIPAVRRRTMTSVERAAERETETEQKPGRRTNAWAWGVLGISLAAFVCGGVLLVWSYLGHRAELWNIGIPFALVGQAGLILGLILQLDGLWQSNHATSATLDELDDHVSELRHATTMLSTVQSSPSQSFYTHFAEGAKPDLLLADLKGQLDLLATRLAGKN